ncbi:MAG: hypothetical protein LUG98_05185 [Tannerellaceae bacterium]|nr:hypothetical protein [Tannerellaceae bacterium]
MKKIYPILACLFILWTAGANNINSYNPGVISTTPQSLHFEKYLNHAVTEYNGLPVIRIPVHEIKVKGVTIPITLSYHAGGIKYRQYDGDIAAGWSIAAGGFRVSRTLKNRPDENSIFYSQTELDKLTSTGDIDRYLGGMVIKENPEHGGATQTSDDMDGEYDLFSYITPTTSGNFIIHDRKNAQNVKTTIMEGHNDIITMNVSNPTATLMRRSLTHMAIKDDQGNDYLFGDNDSNLNYTERQTGVDWKYRLTPLAWTLKEINTPHQEKVKFTYEKFSPAVDWTWPTTLTIQDAELSKQSGPHREYTSGYRTAGTSWSDLLFVKKIETDKESVEFIRYGNSHKVANERHLVKEILIKNKLTNETKTIRFNRQRVWSHHLLNSIEVSVSGMVPTQKHTFTYYQPAAGKTEANTYPDQWGYYTYREAADRSQGMLHDKFKTHLFVQKTTNAVDPNVTGQVGTYFHEWANRSGNAGSRNASHLFSLKEITFPTGGTTSYEYEENQYYSAYQRKTVKGGGQRVKKITSDPKNGTTPVISVFRYGENENGTGTAAFPLEANVFGSERLIFPATRIVRESSFFVSRTYSTLPVGDATQSLFTVAYPKVTVYRYDQTTNKYNGKTISTYDRLKKYTAEYISGSSPLNFFMVSNLMQPLNIIQYNMGRNPRLLDRTTYDPNNKIVQKEEFNYQTTSSAGFKGLKVDQQVWLGANNCTTTLPNPDNHNPYHHVAGIYQTQPVHHQAGRFLLKEKKVTHYPTEGEPVMYKENYTYDSYYRLSKTTRARSGGGTIVQEFSYPTSGELFTKNMISTVVKTKTTSNGQAAGVEQYVYPSTAIYPGALKRSATNETAANLRTVATFNRYDSRGNLLQYTGANGIPVTYIWSYKQTHPVAEIVNATYTQVQEKLPVSITTIGKGTKGEEYMSDIDNLRDELPEAHISTFLYKPLVGITRHTNPQGLNTSYEYDGFGRLITEKNQDEKVVRNYEYNHTGMYAPLGLALSGGSASFPVNIPQTFTATGTGGSGQREYHWAVKNSSGTVEQTQAYSSNRNFTYTGKATGQKTLTCTMRDKVTQKTKSSSRTLQVVAAGPVEFTNITKDASSTTTRHIYTATLKCPVTATVSFRITFDGSPGCSAWFDFGNFDNYYQWPVDETLHLHRVAGDHKIKITVTSDQPYFIPAASLTITAINAAGVTIGKSDRIDIH